MAIRTQHEIEIKVNKASGTKYARDVEKYAASAKIKPIDLRLNNKASLPLGRIRGEVGQFEKSLDAASARVISFGATVSVINGVTNAFKDLVRQTISVEKALTDINVILQANTEQLEGFRKGLFDVARSTANTFDTVARAATELSRQGLSIEQTLERTRSALILTRLSGLDAAKAVESLTAILNGFDIQAESTTRIVSKLAAVDAAFAVSSGDLSDSLQRSASVARDAGVSLDELLSLTAAVQQRTARGGKVIGNAFKTIFTRLQRSTTIRQLQELGVEIDASQSGTQKLASLADALDKVSDPTRANKIKELAAGVRQVSILSATLQDLRKETSLYGSALSIASNATDEAVRRNDALNQTLSALISQTGTSVQELLSSLGDISIGDNLKFFISSVQGAIEGISDLVDSEGAGASLAKGLIKGIGNFIAGPGAIVFTGVFIRLFLEIGKQITNSFRDLVGLNKEATQQKRLQETIGVILQKSDDKTRRILLSNRDLNTANKTLVATLEQELRLMNAQERSVARLAGAARSAGFSIASGGGLRKAPIAPDGYIPDTAREALAIVGGVGGAKKGDKPVYIPNFNYGDKRGPLVANTGEKIIKNFLGGSGSAVINREMAAKMGNLSDYGNVVPVKAGGYTPTAAGGFFGGDNPNVRFKAGLRDVSGKALGGQFANKQFNSLMSQLSQSLASGATKQADRLYNIIETQTDKVDPQSKKLILDSTNKLYGKGGALTQSLSTAFDNAEKQIAKASQKSAPKGPLPPRGYLSTNVSAQASTNANIESSRERGKISLADYVARKNAATSSNVSGARLNADAEVRGFSKTLKEANVKLKNKFDQFTVGLSRTFTKTGRDLRRIDNLINSGVSEAEATSRVSDRRKAKNARRDKFSRAAIPASIALSLGAQFLPQEGLAGAVGGAATGASIGALFGPIGLGAGAVVGGLSKLIDVFDQTDERAVKLSETLSNAQSSMTQVDNAFSSFSRAQSSINDIVQSGGSQKDIDAAIQSSLSAFAAIGDSKLQSKIINAQGNLQLMEDAFNEFKSSNIASTKILEAATLAAQAADDRTVFGGLIKKSDALNPKELTGISSSLAVSLSSLTKAQRDNLSSQLSAVKTTKQFGNALKSFASDDGDKYVSDLVKSLDDMTDPTRNVQLLIEKLTDSFLSQADAIDDVGDKTSKFTKALGEYVRGLSLASTLSRSNLNNTSESARSQLSAGITSAKGSFGLGRPFAQQSTLKEVELISKQVEQALERSIFEASKNIRNAYALEGLTTAASADNEDRRRVTELQDRLRGGESIDSVISELVALQRSSETNSASNEKIINELIKIRDANISADNKLTSAENDLKIQRDLLQKQTEQNNLLSAFGKTQDILKSQLGTAGSLPNKQLLDFLKKQSGGSGLAGLDANRQLSSLQLEFRKNFRGEQFKGLETQLFGSNGQDNLAKNIAQTLASQVAASGATVTKELRDVIARISVLRSEELDRTPESKQAEAFKNAISPVLSAQESRLSDILAENSSQLTELQKIRVVLEKRRIDENANKVNEGKRQVDLSREALFGSVRNANINSNSVPNNAGKQIVSALGEGGDLSFVSKSKSLFKSYLSNLEIELTRAVKKSGNISELEDRIGSDESLRKILSRAEVNGEPIFKSTTNKFTESGLSFIKSNSDLFGIQDSAEDFKRLQKALDISVLELSNFKNALSSAKSDAVQNKQVPISSIPNFTGGKNALQILNESASSAIKTTTRKNSVESYDYIKTDEASEKVNEISQSLSDFINDTNDQFEKFGSESATLVSKVKSGAAQRQNLLSVISSVRDDIFSVASDPFASKVSKDAAGINIRSRFNTIQTQINNSDNLSPENLRELKERMAELQNAGNEFGIDLTSSLDPLEGVLSGLKVGFEELTVTAASSAQTVQEAWSDVPQTLSDGFADAFSDAISGAQDLETAVRSMLASVTADLGRMHMRQAFSALTSQIGIGVGANTGGLVSGTGIQRKAIGGSIQKTLLTGGEFVASPDLVKKTGIGFWQKMNQGRLMAPSDAGKMRYNVIPDSLEGAAPSGSASSTNFSRSSHGSGYVNGGSGVVDDRMMGLEAGSYVVNRMQSITHKPVLDMLSSGGAVQKKFIGGLIGQILGGALQGAAVGAATSAITGEDIGKGALMGGIGGGVAGGIGYGMSALQGSAPQGFMSGFKSSFSWMGGGKGGSQSSGASTLTGADSGGPFGAGELQSMDSIRGSFSEASSLSFQPKTSLSTSGTSMFSTAGATSGAKTGFFNQFGKQLVTGAALSALSGLLAPNSANSSSGKTNYWTDPKYTVLSNDGSVVLSNKNSDKAYKYHVNSHSELNSLLNDKNMNVSSGFGSGIFPPGMSMGGFIRRMEAGGVVHGHIGADADSVPALLTTGEGVASRKAMRHLINTMGYEQAEKFLKNGMNKGGIVGAPPMPPAVSSGGAPNVNIEVNVNFDSGGNSKVNSSASTDGSASNSELKSGDRLTGRIVEKIREVIKDEYRPGGLLDTNKSKV